MDMDISIISDRNNPLLHRREIKFTVSFDAATPSIKDVKMKLVAVLNANKQVLVVDTLDQIFGKLEAEGYAKIYNDEKAMATIETKSVLEKNKIEEEAEAEVAEE
ncbi:MAG: small subunit ribosomal protein S24e [Methanococcus sp.]|uniref:Small ribosomal subunit protein eS24 n=2 Tax=Methanococcus maripaludis TaxID=39152 RepID=A0A2L1C9H4_METMI|nr:30S ribosomal protein S24e [Methanococcus maripaludis]MDK2928688.1 small subunit ribosomal protein S24e [Methanococcus sp.]